MENIQTAPSSRFDSWILQLLTRFLRRLDQGRLTVYAEDQRQVFDGRHSGPEGEIRLHAPRRLLIRLLRRGDVGFAEGYIDGDWSTPDLAQLLLFLGVNEHSLGRIAQGGTLNRLVSRLSRLGRANTRRGSRRNIAAHYDLGNDFYRLWLDPSMTYSAGIFDQPSATLADAQRAKYRRVLKLSGAREGEQVLEIGCGWGGFALEAARAGIAVTGLSLSREQLAFAREAVRDNGLRERIDLRQQDYRDVEGRFDHIVSIEMFEAVGEAYWPTYMQRLRDLLRPGGRAVLQVITIDEAAFETYRKRADFIQQYIFPGGQLPSKQALREQVEGAGLTLSHEETGGQDYAHTLALWHANFVEHLSEIRALGYDERFIRMWRYYLALCEAGFRCGRIDLGRVVLDRAPD
jgi:cyclopropane-fatty-acyl-phospholipid synthase